LFLSCVCVCVGSVVFCRCVCLCDLLIFLPEPLTLGVWGVVLVVCVCVSGVLFSVGVCGVCVCDLLIFLPEPLTHCVCVCVCVSGLGLRDRLQQPQGGRIGNGNTVYKKVNPLVFFLFLQASDCATDYSNLKGAVDVYFAGQTESRTIGLYA